MDTNKLIWIVMAFIAGSFLPIQAGINAKLGKAGGSAVHASMFSFVVGAVALILYIILTKQTVSWAGLKAAPLSAWAGGLLGAFYVTVIVLSFPKLGPGLTFGLVVAGQMLISALLEHFNILVASPQPLSLLRVVGMAMVVGGVVIMRKF
ncbi:MAG TPA: DMT family transporter [Chitinophagales bacterium]|nr:DMT family transporter [Chitinophagales bacterium]